MFKSMNGNKGNKRHLFRKLGIYDIIGKKGKITFFLYWGWDLKAFPISPWYFKSRPKITSYELAHVHPVLWTLVWFKFNCPPIIIIISMHKVPDSSNIFISYAATAASFVFNCIYILHCASALMLCGTLGVFL